jgi:hypothetical protein
MFYGETDAEPENMGKNFNDLMGWTRTQPAPGRPYREKPLGDRIGQFANS